MSGRIENESFFHLIPLRAYLLGPPRVEWAGRPLSIPRRQTRGLLYRLAARQQPIPREQLCFLFWPDIPESAARRHLSHLLTHLRRALPAPEVLLDAADQVGLDPQRVWSDTVAFEQLCGALTPSPLRPSPPLPRLGEGEGGWGGRGEDLPRAVDLYRGSFLAGFSLPESPEFEMWLARQQGAYEHLYLQALVALIEERAAGGEYAAAIAYAQRYLDTDDLTEDVHRRLIELYAAVGNRGAALRQFERCAAALERELGVSPLPETRAVYQAVLADQSPPRLAIRPAWTTLPGLEVPLVGRAEAVRRLEEAYARAQAGHGGVVLISGEAGIGKSRLMQEFAIRLAGQALILTGAGHPETQTMPYQPIIEALRTMLRHGDTSPLTPSPLHPSSPLPKLGEGKGGWGVGVRAPSLSLSPVWLSEASRLLPELRTLYPDLPPPLPAEPDEARSRLFEALCQIVLGLATSPLTPSPLRPSPPLPRLGEGEGGWGDRSEGPLLLCLDDLHWADSATLDWLAYLGRHLCSPQSSGDKGASRLLVIGAYRSEEADAVGELRYNLARTNVLFELKLSGLDVADVLHLLQRLTPLPPHPLSPGSSPKIGGGVGVGGVRGEVARRLQQATGGNPFFLLETLRALMETGRLPGSLADVEDLPLPDTIRQVVEARLRRLGPTARQILEAAAVLGSSFGFDLVRLTAGRRELETMDGLDELVARQLLIEQEGGSETRPYYRFHHDLTLRVVEAGLSPMRRQLLHRRAGQALERLEPEAVAALARHFDLGDEPKKALHYHGLAARQAMALFAWREAEEHQSRMLALLERLDPRCAQPDCLARRGQVLVERAHQRYLQGRLTERDADLAALTALAEATGDQRLRLQAALHRTRYLNLGGRYQEAIAAAEAGLACRQTQKTAPPLAPASSAVKSTLCHLLVEIGFAHYLLGQPREGLATLESAVAIAGEGAGPELQGPIAHHLGYIYLHLGEYARALAYQQDAYACHQAAGDYNGMAWAGLDMGFLYLKLGRFPEAEQHLSESLGLAQRIGARPAEAYARTYLGYWELYRGNYAAAVECLRQSLPLHQAVRQEHGAVAAEIGLGLALYHLGDHTEARLRLQSAVERARAATHRRRLVEALVGLGLVELADGHAPAARRYLTEAVELARISECYEGLASGLAALARAERKSGDYANALAHAGEAVRFAQESALPVCEMWGEVEVGLALLAQGQPAAALEHTGRAAALLPHAHEGWIGTEEVHRAHARILQALGRNEEAEEHLRQADAIVEAKAARIPDRKQRQRYFQFTHSLIR